MDVTITLPDEVVERLQQRWGDVARRLLEDIVLDGYRAGVLDEADLRRVLGLATRFDVQDFLYAHHVPLVTLDDLQHDRDTSQRLGL